MAVSSLPAKRGINRAQQSRHSAPAALVVEALAIEGLPQADQQRPLREKHVDHLGGGLIHLLHPLPPYPGGGEAISIPSASGRTRTLPRRVEKSLRRYLLQLLL